MQTRINALLLLLGIGFPLGVYFSLMHFIHRHNYPDRFEAPDTIDYHKW